MAAARARNTDAQRRRRASRTLSQAADTRESSTTARQRHRTSLIRTQAAGARESSTTTRQHRRATRTPSQVAADRELWRQLTQQQLERERAQYATADEVREANERGYPIAPTMREVAQLLHEVMNAEDDLGESVREDTCVVCDQLYTRTKLRRIDRLPLLAWRVLQHHVHTDSSWLRRPRNLGALHQQCDVSVATRCRATRYATASSSSTGAPLRTTTQTAYANAP
jgi:hypothetical protein